MSDRAQEALPHPGEAPGRELELALDLVEPLSSAREPVSLHEEVAGRLSAAFEELDFVDIREDTGSGTERSGPAIMTGRGEPRIERTDGDAESRWSLRIAVPMSDSSLILEARTRDSLGFGPRMVACLRLVAGQVAAMTRVLHERDAVQRSRDALETLIDDAGLGVLTVDRDRRITRWSRGMERILGRGAERALGTRYDDLVAEDSQAGDPIARGLEGRTQTRVEERLLRLDGSRIDASVTLSPIAMSQGAMDALTLIVGDVTDHREMERSLRAMHRQIRESEEKFLGMIERSAEAIFIVDASSRTVVQANAEAEAITGMNRARMIGRAFEELHPETDRDLARAQIDRALARGAGESVEIRLRRERGGPLDVEFAARILNYGGRHVVQWGGRDISARREAQEKNDRLRLQLIQSEKLSAIGQLIGGIAHELNNPLTGVIGYSQLMASQNSDQKLRRGLEHIRKEARRCHRIVQNLLTFARQHAPQKKRISINDVLESTIELHAYQLRVDNIRIERHYSKDLPCALGDFHQLRQAFLNIIVNAHQALQGMESRGLIRITTAHVDGKIRVTIQDDGRGIPRKNLHRIFDPFYTTRPREQGSGLGLSTCFGIVEEHAGSITASSQPGAGATFTVDLPMAPEGTSEERVAAVPDLSLGEGPGSGRILVVDDEASIVDVLVEALNGEGYEVETAGNGRLALRKIASGGFDAVISDLKMPGMGGRELYREVQRMHPDIARRFLFATGDVIGGDTREFLEASGVAWIEKPFEIREILARVGRIIAAA